MTLLRAVACAAALAGCAAPRGATGTCFFVAPDRAISSLHVVRGARAVWVRDAAGRTARAVVEARDEAADLVELAVAGLATEDGAAPATLALAATDAPIGAPVTAFQFRTRDGLRASRGSVVTDGAIGEPFLLGTSVPAERGTSGGPLVDARGAVVGVMVRRRAGEPLAFAVKASRVRAAFPALAAAAPAPTTAAPATTTAAPTPTTAAPAPTTAAPATTTAAPDPRAAACQVLTR